MLFRIDPDITRAETLPAGFYRDPNVFQDCRERIFQHSWQLVEDPMTLMKNSAHPFLFLEGMLEEPLVLTKDDAGRVHCLSNVCTHRGNLIVDEERSCRNLTCGYHGRQFDLSGKFRSMPEFNAAIDFPRAEDHLRPFPLLDWGPLKFTALSPEFEFEKILDRLEERLGFLPLEEAVFSASRSKTYHLQANWALYCDNFLEGFHIPFVHKGLNEVLKYSQYQIELDEYFNVQIGRSDDPEFCFDFPPGHPDEEENIAAYYYWVFPNLMINVYPWGLSINVVKPMDLEKTRISFLSYVFDESKLESGAGADLHRVEMEDEEIVLAVQKGVKSRFYRSGRFSPTMEKGVHHFHTLIANALK